MNKNLKLTGSINISVSADKIWDVLTNPEKIKIYLGIPETITDWKPGSPIVWRGEIGGQQFEDKGKVLENRHGKLLRFEYWSSFGGYEDIPENYSIITYTLDKLNDKEIKFTYIREKIPTREEQQMFEEYLPAVLDGIKQLSEAV